MGKDVRLGAVSILHGGFSVEISTVYAVSQPAPQSQGKTEVVPQTEVQAKDKPARRLEIGEGASIEELVGRVAGHGSKRARCDFDPAGDQGRGCARCRTGGDLMVRQSDPEASR